MVSIVKFVNEAEEKYGSIYEAPLNCIEFQRFRVALGINPFAKKHVIESIEQVMVYVDHGYTASETAQLMRVKLKDLKSYAKKNGIRFHQYYQYRAEDKGKLYFSATYGAICRKVKPYKVQKITKHFADVPDGAMYFEHRRWRVK